MAPGFSGAEIIASVESHRGLSNYQAVRCIDRAVLGFAFGWTAPCIVLGRRLPLIRKAHRPRKVPLRRSPSAVLAMIDPPVSTTFVNDAGRKCGVMARMRSA